MMGWLLATPRATFSAYRLWAIEVATCVLSLKMLGRAVTHCHTGLSLYSSVTRAPAGTSGMVNEY